MPGGPAELFETRTSRDRNESIPNQRNHVLVWQVINLLILEGLMKSDEKRGSDEKTLQECPSPYPSAVHTIALPRKAKLGIKTSSLVN
jgi:hypothetical protein